jgi:predicted metal-dependent enzyme (double-stranded beta helix superfamily)
MSSMEKLRSISRREALLGTGAALAAARTTRAAEPVRKSPSPPGFDLERFVEDCKRANTGSPDSQHAIQEVMSRAFSNPGAVLTAVGEPAKGGIQPIYRSAGLTILNIVWSPLMQLIPHEHNMWSLIGIYTGREDNIFWRREGHRVTAVSAKAISAGGVTPLPRDVIHSVSNPIEKLTGAIHIYGGDFFATPRSEWDPETLAEREWSLQRAVKTFADSNERFFGTGKDKACR